MALRSLPRAALRTPFVKSCRFLFPYIFVTRLLKLDSARLLDVDNEWMTGRLVACFIRKNLHPRNWEHNFNYTFPRQIHALLGSLCIVGCNPHLGTILILSAGNSMPFAKQASFETVPPQPRATAASADPGIAFVVHECQRTSANTTRIANSCKLGRRQTQAAQRVAVIQLRLGAEAREKIFEGCRANCLACFPCERASENRQTDGQAERQTKENQKLRKHGVPTSRWP